MADILGKNLILVAASLNLMQLGCRLLELLTETAYVQPPVDQSADTPPDIRPAFRHVFKIATRDPGSERLPFLIVSLFI